MLAKKKPHAKPKEGWRKPLEGKLMINVDAAFDVDSEKGETGVVIRDYTGQCIAASQRFLPHVVDAPMAEVYAFREGLVLAQRIGCNNFTCQTDCVQVVDTMKNGGFSATAAATIYDDSIILWSGFGSVDLVSCNREANQVAHELASDAFRTNNSCTWVDEPPRFILSKLTNDVSIF
jgi:ribonuclease HI